MSRTKTRQGQAAARAGAARQAPSPRDPRRLVAHGLSALRRRHLAYAGAALVVVVAVAVAFAVFGGGDDRPPIPDTRARHYTETDACLLTGESGVAAGTRGADAWQGMRDASARTRARVSYTPVTGEQTVGNATPFLNGMLQRSCEVVVASGRAELAAARLVAPAHPKVRFVLAGAGVAKGDGDNITTAGTARAAVARAVEAAASR
ncbi:hypothetical protein [Streptomyces sp. NPDC002666]